MQLLGKKGQSVTDERVWLIKTNHPSLTISAKTAAVRKVICLVRNPLDVLESYADQVLTLSSELSVKAPAFSIQNEFKDWWTEWIKLQSFNYRLYFDTLI